MKSSTKVRSFGLLSLCAGFAACGGATPPPRELTDARAAYQRAQAGPASQFRPEVLTDARKSLNQADQAYAASVDDQDVKTLAYIAERKAELADIAGHDALNVQEQQQAATEIQKIAAQQQSSMSQQLQSEQQQRADAERRAQEAMDRLSQAGANVHQEERGIVVTLPGQVLFTTGQATLVPPARQKLIQVADVLKEEPSRQIIVEGHTDSTGSAETNRVLSQRRADSVKEFLVSRGMQGDQITTKGMGPSEPVASNATAEGRANNRRVDIILIPPPSQQKK
jgi:outer membrane protein OmpA-like peptidoglycan-associated protein